MSNAKVRYRRRRRALKRIEDWFDTLAGSAYGYAPAPVRAPLPRFTSTTEGAPRGHHFIRFY